MKNAEKPALFSLGWWRDAALLNLGAVLVAMGVYFFKFPNHFTTGGVSGLSILMHRYLPGLTTATLNLILNLLLLLVGVLCLGRSFGLRTAYATVVSSLATMFFEWALPMSAPMTSQPLLELIFAVALPSVGTALLFQVGASSGGTDVIAMLIKKYSHFNIGTGLAMADVTVALWSCFAFGMETGLISLFGLFLKSVLVDTVIESLNRKKSFILVTSDPEAVAAFITHDLHRSATIWEAKGAYSHETKWVVLAALNRAQAVTLRRHLKETDPHAFMLITNSSEIFGKGFLRV